MTPRTLTTLAACLAATAALAHSGVKDPQVMARMDGMVVLEKETKVLGQMARGITGFDATEAGRALAALQAEAARVAPLFEPQADDPKSEALPAIWQDWDDFAAKATGLEAALASVDVSTEDGLRASMRTIGGACSACHKAYRE